MLCSEPGCRKHISPKAPLPLCAYHACAWDRDARGRFRKALSGQLNITMSIRGFEVDDGWEKAFEADPDLKAAVLDEWPCA